VDYLQNTRPALLACDGPLAGLAIRLQPMGLHGWAALNQMGVFMRKLFLLGLSTLAVVMLGGSAQAADMPVKAPPPPPPIMYNWTGFYIGGHIGGAWVNRNGNDRFDGNDCASGAFGIVCFNDGNFGRNNGRFIGGGQVGFNYQINQWVWGVEGQISAITNQNNDDLCGNVRFTPVVGVVVNDRLFRCDNRGSWIATAAARLGVTFGPTGNWLLYVKGGGAFADSRFGDRLRDDCLGIFGAALCNSNCVFDNDNRTRTGWMVGVGLEYGAWGNWSWKLEYNFMDFGHRDMHFDNIMPGCACILARDLDFDLRVNLVKFGLNYRFGVAPAPAPVAARY
jgi:outer membrane immunogenic protein